MQLSVESKILKRWTKKIDIKKKRMDERKNKQKEEQGLEDLWVM